MLLKVCHPSLMVLEKFGFRCLFSFTSVAVRKYVDKQFAVGKHALVRKFCYRNTSTSTSYVKNESSEPLLNHTVGEVLDKTADAYGDRDAVVVHHQNVRKKFSEFKKDVDQLALGFLALNLKKGDRVAIWAPNCYEWIVCQFATAKIGLILVNINPANQAPELLQNMKSVGCKTLIAAERFLTQDYYKILSTVVPEICNSRPGEISSKKLPEFESLIMMTNAHYPGAYRYKDIARAGSTVDTNALYAEQSKLSCYDPINVQFSSGTTGIPKAVTLTHHNIVNNAYFAGKRIGYHLEIHRICSSVPLCHTFGMVIGVLCGTIHGSCIVIPGPRFDAFSALDAIQKERCTSVYGTPTMFLDMLNHPEIKTMDVSSLKTGIVGGAPCLPELVFRIVKEMNCPGLVGMYGTTETGPIIFAHYKEDSAFIKANTIGTVLEHVEAKIVDKDGNTVLMGETGEICARGYLTMTGYWGQDDKTMESLTSDGWFHTGDLGIITEDGRGKVKGRIKDMICRGGENIYPAEIENHLLSHPAIEEAHVFGIPHDRMGEEVCCWIKLKPNTCLTELDIIGHCKGNLSHFKIPKVIRFVKEFPKSAIGKVNKLVLKKEMLNIMNKKK